MPKRSWFDEMMEAVAFAEEGEAGTAGRIASEALGNGRGEEPRGGRIVAVGGAPGFSRRLVEGSVGMAERLRCGLVALSVPLVPSRLADRTGEPAEPWLSARAFAGCASARGIPLVHAARDGDPDRAVADVQRMFRRVAFLVIDPAVTPRARFSTVSIPIVSLAGE